MREKELRHYVKYLVFAVFILFAFLAFLVIKPFIGSIVLGLFLCYVFYPVYRRLRAVVRHPSVASALMIALLSLVIIVPVALIAQLIVVELLNLYNQFSMESAVAWFSNYFGPEMQDVLITLAKQLLAFLAGLLSAFVLSLPQKVLNGFVLLLTMFMAFRGGEGIVEHFRRMFPVNSLYKKEFIDRFSQATNAIVYGIVVVSLVQGIAAMIGFYIFGVSSPALWGFLTFIAALLPVIGPAVVWVPMVIVKYVSGDISAAIGLMVYCLIVQSLLLDLVLKAKVIGTMGKVSPVIVLLGIVGGVMAFGIVGILLGPIALVIFLEFLKVYFGKNAFRY